MGAAVRQRTRVEIAKQEDWEFLVRNKALEESRMRAVETDGCPHAAIRDVGMNFAGVCVHVFVSCERERKTEKRKEEQRQK
ncbi:hypothetical protein CHS0354_022862 [Potamilus streckersoni]|uniref:Uncharacterized protein n=1 Tax=Potamilus streckersoni TaxID=2493646 RepID=A0AAE0VP35_9BIVA|nr:hypothetical protein CHS0354_022862 [Potamilus streckersoni]